MGAEDVAEEAESFPFQSFSEAVAEEEAVAGAEVQATQAEAVGADLAAEAISAVEARAAVGKLN